MINWAQCLEDFSVAVKNERRWRQREGYSLSHFWGGANQDIIEKTLNQATSSEDAITRILEEELYVHRVPEDLVDKSIEWHLCAFSALGLRLDLLPADIQESVLFPSSQTRWQSGRRLSPDLFRHLYVADLARKLIAAVKRPRVLELGAGCGKVASLFKRLFGPSTYFICDIPETLVFARLYLSQEHPEAKILWVKDVTDVQSSSVDSFEYVLVPVMYARFLSAGSFDLFMNFHSLGEFDNSSIRFWMRWLQGASRPHHLLVCNRYLNPVAGGTQDVRLLENEASVSYDYRWQPLIWELEPKYLRCPYVRTMQSRYLLFGARDGGSQPLENRIRESNRCIASAREMNSWRALMDGSPTSFRRAMLSHDLSMSGTLFLLWNANRLNESIHSLFFLLRYLDFILPPPTVFVEERSYYVSRLGSLLSEVPPDKHVDVRRYIAETESRIKEGRRRVELLTSYREHNIVQVGEALLAVRQDLGPIDFSRERFGDREWPPFLLRVELSSLELEAAVTCLKQRIDALCRH